ncbi:MAG: FAR7a/AIG1-like protein [Gammaproteobacteria bacterium]|jgi:hypothetical protein|nr:FAR7a/AIG1-like protein [Gammaproteobacteria bacterium]
MQSPSSNEEALIFARSRNRGLSTTRKVSWWVLGAIYLGIIIHNLTVQDKESWPPYAFRLTQDGAYLCLLQHLIHPHSPLLRPHNAYIQGNGRWRCLRDDNYTHTEGFSNLALSLEGVIPILYWGLAFPVAADITTPNSYVSAGLMHGAISLAILADYFFNNRPFHFAHTLVNLALFMGIYTLWNYAGQKIQSDPIYPIIDWEREPMKALIAVGIACASAVLTTAALKGLFTLRDRGCRTQGSRPFFDRLQEQEAPSAPYQAPALVVLITPYN